MCVAAVVVVVVAEVGAGRLRCAMRACVRDQHTAVAMMTRGRLCVGLLDRAPRRP